MKNEKKGALWTVSYETYNMQKTFCIPQILTMTTVGEARRSFLEAAPSAQTSIDAGSVEAIDLVGMQLMIAMLGVETDGVAPRLSALSAPVAQVFQRAGAPLPETH